MVSSVVDLDDLSWEETSFADAAFDVVTEGDDDDSLASDWRSEDVRGRGVWCCRLLVWRFSVCLDLNRKRCRCLYTMVSSFSDSTLRIHDGINTEESGSALWSKVC